MTTVSTPFVYDYNTIRSLKHGDSIHCYFGLFKITICEKMYSFVKFTIIKTDNSARLTIRIDKIAPDTIHCYYHRPLQNPIFKRLTMEQFSQITN